MSLTKRPRSARDCSNQAAWESFEQRSSAPRRSRLRMVRRALASAWRKRSCDGCSPSPAPASRKRSIRSPGASVNMNSARLSSMRQGGSEKASVEVRSTSSRPS